MKSDETVIVVHQFDPAIVSRPERGGENGKMGKGLWGKIVCSFTETLEDKRKGGDESRFYSISLGGITS